MSTDFDRERIERALERARQELLGARNGGGYWEGELSSSALSTATAVCALAIVLRENEAALAQAGSGVKDARVRVQRGLEWLAQHANEDGGWGDTVLSVSNLSTTALVWAAFGVVPGADAKYRRTVAAAEQWITQHAGGITPEVLAPAVIQRYGKDRTFSVPILTMCALAGRMGDGRNAWKYVIPLPFELAALPHRWFAALRLPVVSYALPALIAIGLARHVHRPSGNPLPRLLRNATRARTLRVLGEIQPENGGFLEATPLTSFVTMSLAGSGLAGHRVVAHGVRFLLEAQRADGSWPIDTNLATWLTTLSVNALGDYATTAELAPARIRDWLLGQHHKTEHPYTHAAPGGWAWTDLPGGVPDADDTAGAVLALHRLAPADEGARKAAAQGITWLLDLQNRDGGIPTFCRGWGALPFDRSSADLTAHALRAWQAWRADLPESLQNRVAHGIEQALGFLRAAQHPDGSWCPLWFGCQHAPDEQNPTYGTARVIAALAEMDTAAADSLQRGMAWLVQNQNADGGWGGRLGCPSTTEETALAVEALALAARNPKHAAIVRTALQRGTLWLANRVESGQWLAPAPIGFYFARLWYFERLYPVIFTVGALTEAVRRAV